VQEDAGIRVRHAGVGEKRKYKKQSTADKPILYSMCANDDFSCDDCTVFDKIGGQDGKTIQREGARRCGVRVREASIKPEMLQTEQ
jgi:Fe2+ or Zn2+ uptake regulation protein